MSGQYLGIVLNIYYFNNVRFNETWALYTKTKESVTYKVISFRFFSWNIQTFCAFEYRH